MTCELDHECISNLSNSGVNTHATWVWRGGDLENELLTVGGLLQFSVGESQIDGVLSVAGVASTLDHHKLAIG